MRIGLETLAWGRNFRSLGDIATAAAQLGYAGIEISQHIDLLGSPIELSALLAKCEVLPISLATGSLPARIQYSAALEAQYVYSDEICLDSMRQARELDQIVGLHPHFYKDIETVENAEPYLAEFPHLGLVLDVAHLHLAGSDVVKQIERAWPRLLAIHLKDWSSQYGADPFRFAEGFTGLGTGELGETLQRVCHLLAERQFPGWVVVEQHVAHGSPRDCAARSLEWLHKQGI